MDARRAIALVSLGLVCAVVVGLIATSGGTDDSDPPTAAAVDRPTSPPAAAHTPDTPELPDRGPHPEFLDVQEWLQTDATSFDDFDGKVLAVQFWTFGCSNCKATYPHMRDLHAKYSGDDFEIIGVHAPEFDFERDVGAVADAARENGLIWPIAIDNEKLNFRSWQERRFWPRVFIIDKLGNVRYDHIGEGAYDDIDAAVGALIAEGRDRAVIEAFVEAVRSIGQVCNLVILVPVALTIVAARGRWSSVVGAVAGVMLGGWIFATGWLSLSDPALRVSAVLLIASAGLLGAPRLFGRAEIVRHPAGVGVVTGGVAVLVTQWWRPCVGEQLGSILTDAPDRPWSQLLPTAGFMLGLSIPLIAVGLLYAAMRPEPSVATRLGWMGCVLTVVLGASVVAGQHGEIVFRLFQWSQ